MEDGTIVFVFAGVDSENIYFLNPDGTLKAKLEDHASAAGNVSSGPVVLRSGIIAVADRLNCHKRVSLHWCASS